MDSYVNVDENTFYKAATDLSKLSFDNIWKTAFTTYRYKDSPLFCAYTGTLQRWADLRPFYGLLFQKLNVALCGSFIPGVLYLLCQRVSNTDRRTAFKASIGYALLSFVFFYSLGMMRDIHIALIYAIGLYIITGNNYSFKNYLALILLGAAAYFIRIENGLFFVVFLGAWILQSESRYKPFAYLFSALILLLFFFVIGGVGTLLGTASETVDVYSTRGIAIADKNSLGVMLDKLPIPLNYISKTVFGQISPFPFWLHLSEGRNWVEKLFYLPQSVASLFWCLVWYRILTHLRELKPFWSKYKWVIVLVIVYIVAVSAGQALPRRLQAVYPMVFMAYIFINKKLFIRKEVLNTFLIYSLLLLIYGLLKL
ncbi:MAG TPA: hypothetical protein VL053_03705 [Arachidicoccus sp.]|nr:hypothetical protein [Arachidicoccus sp.]